MRALRRVLLFPLVPPSLGVAAVSVGSVYLSLLLLPKLPERYAQLLGHIAPILIFWISLRVLLKVANPPEKVFKSIIFALLLLNLVIGAAGVIGVVWHLAQLE